MPSTTAATVTTNPEHEAWLIDALLAEDGPPPAPVIFSETQKSEQLAAVRVIGDRLRQARELCNISQTVAAKRLGYTNSSKLSKVENATDTNSVPLWLILRAARAYEVSADFLLGLTDEWETGVARGVSGWMLDAWQKARERDLDSLVRLHAEIKAVSAHITTLAAGVREVSQAVETFRLRNPSFVDQPASGTVVGRLERLQTHAHDAELTLRRFHVGLVGADNPGGN